MTSIVPRAPYTDEELRSLYPSNLRLHQVQVLLRHGERTPISVRFQNTGLPAFWPYCPTVRLFNSAIVQSKTPPDAATPPSALAPAPTPTTPDSTEISTLQWRRRLETFARDSDAPVLAAGPRDELDGLCDLGALTNKGYLTTLALGQRLRHLYVDRLGFLPSSIDSADFLYIRSTPVPRSLESVQQVFTGLYPPTKRAENFPPPTILLRSHADETLFPNDGNCRRFAALSRAFAQRTADRWNDSEEMANVNKLIGKYMPEYSPRVAVDSKPRLLGIMDTVTTTAAHGPTTRLPRAFYDAKAVRDMERIAVEEWFSGYQESREYRTLGIGGLLGDIVSRMVRSTREEPPDHRARHGPSTVPAQTPIRFGLSGCHDTTLAAVMSSLGAFGDRWPPFTSHIAIELFCSPESPSSASPSSRINWTQSFKNLIYGTQPPSPKDDRIPTPMLSEEQKRQLEGYYVRVRYNDEPVTIPGCRATGKHLDGNESFCTLAAFKEVVDKFTPTNWRDQCSSNRNAPAFPAKPEPAGY